jgi:hypothetical protein
LSPLGSTHRHPGEGRDLVWQGRIPGADQIRLRRADDPTVAKIFSDLKAVRALADPMKLLFPLALLATATALAAEPKSLGEPAPPRISNLVVYGEDPCPRSSDDEIIVCARQPESDRYRIPKSLRKHKKTDEPAVSWAARTRTLDMVSKKGLPNSCSPHGTGGQTGCMRQFLEAARLEREALKAEQ